MNQLTTINRICEHLEKYVFDKIWNDPYSEYRTFTVAELLTKVATAGIFSGRYDQVQLPSEVSYLPGTSNLFFQVFSIPACQFRSLHLNVLDWVSLEEYCSNNLIDIEFFSEEGRKMVRAGVFIKQAEKNDCILVAVEQTGFSNCLGSIYKGKEEKKFFFGEMFDSDLHPSVVYESLRLRPNELPINQRNAVDPVIKSGVPTYALMNGKLLSGDYMRFLSSYSLIEKVYDENIVGIFDTPSSLTYLNAKNAKERVLIHIPKTMNREHIFITANTCDLYLVPTEMTDNSSPTTKGIYLYQCGRDEHFHQLTHNDFGIDKDWLDTIAAANNFKSYVVRTMVRICDRDKKAIRDANYLNILYLHNDQEIVDFLLGVAEWKMDFWTAESLEDSLYGKATMRRRNVVAQPAATQCDVCQVKNICDAYPKTELPCPSFNRRSLNDYVDLIGYYHTLALIGKRVTYFEVTDDLTGNNEFIVRAPLALQEFGHKDYFVVVYYNGLRLSQDCVEVLIGANAANVHNKELEFTADASWWTKVIDVNYAYRLRVIVKNHQLKTGDKVVVEVFDSRERRDAEDKPIKIVDMPAEAEWRLTQDTEFQRNKRYFFKTVYEDPETHETKDVMHVAVIKEDMIGKPIGPDYEYDVGYTETRTIYNVDGIPYTTEVVVPISEFYDLLNEVTVQLSSEHDWKVYQINEEQDKIFIKTLDTHFVECKTYYKCVTDESIDAQTRVYEEGNDKFIEAFVTAGDRITGDFYERIENVKPHNVTYYKIDDPGTFDKTSLTLNINPFLYKGAKIAIVDGPVALEDAASVDITTESTGYLGKELWTEPAKTLDNEPLDSELIFLNGHRLIRGLDYTMDGYKPGNHHTGARLFLQNVSYLRQHSDFQAIRSNTTTLSNQRGFLKGRIIYWNHQNPFWFDELSILTIGGKVCANIIHEFGTITLTDGKDYGNERDFMTMNHTGGYDNGSPFEFRMSVATKVKDLVGDYHQDEDNRKIEMIKAYYDAKFKKPDYITIVKRSHKIYSLYTEQIVTDYVTNPRFDFSVDMPSRKLFDEQFEGFTAWKARDVVFNLSPEDLKYVDVYPLYNRLQAIDRYQYTKISKLAALMLPSDKYQHKDAGNVK